jgi:hypothetical protein
MGRETPGRTNQIMERKAARSGKRLFTPRNIQYNGKVGLDREKAVSGKWGCDWGW